MNESGSRILVVDDEAGVRDVTSAMLEACGFEVDAAGEGIEALEWLDAGHRYAVVLLDQSLPGMDGSTVAHEIHRRRPEQPIVLASGYGAPDTAQLFAGVLPKPFGVSELVQALEAATATAAERP